MEELTNLVDTINEKAEQFKVSAALNIRGNKAAGARARKDSLAIEKLLKQYRKLSIEAGK